MEVAPKVKLPQLEAVGPDNLAVKSHLHFQFESVDEFVGKVLLGGPVIEELHKERFELFVPLLMYLSELPLQTALELFEAGGTVHTLKVLPEVHSMLDLHQLTPC